MLQDWTMSSIYKQQVTQVAWAKVPGARQFLHFASIEVQLHTSPHAVWQVCQANGNSEAGVAWLWDKLKYQKQLRGKTMPKYVDHSAAVITAKAGTVLDKVTLSVLSPA